MIRQLFGACGFLLCIAACAKPYPTDMRAHRTKEELLAEAEGKLHPVNERQQVEDPNAKIYDRGAAEGLVVTIAKMRRDFPRFMNRPQEKWIAAIRSNRFYRRLNIGPGMNYIFALPDSAGLPRWVMVPTDPTLQPAYLRVNQGALTTLGPPTPPKIVVKEGTLDATLTAYLVGVCIECATGHCNATDTALAY